MRAARRTFLALLLATPVLAGCAGVAIDSYRAERPPIDLRQYFSAPVVGHGMFVGRSGRVERRFVVTIESTWQDQVGVLDERFEWSDGERQRRVWTITRVDESTYTGTADDVVGVAQGRAAGNALHWSYTMALPVGGRVFHVRFDDRMYMIDEQVMLNRATLSWYGIHVGEVLIAFRRVAR